MAKITRGTGGRLRDESVPCQAQVRRGDRLSSSWKCCANNRMRSGFERYGSLPWYSGGMKFDSRVRDLRTLPLYSTGAKDAQMLELERRREFVRACVARNRLDRNGQEIDPVLAFHLGLEKPQE